jgi:hypothetical protein
LPTKTKVHQGSLAQFNLGNKSALQENNLVQKASHVYTFHRIGIIKTKECLDKQKSDSSNNNGTIKYVGGYSI